MNIVMTGKCQSLEESRKERRDFYFFMSVEGRREGPSRLFIIFPPLGMWEMKKDGFVVDEGEGWELRRKVVRGRI